MRSQAIETLGLILTLKQQETLKKLPKKQCGFTGAYTWLKM